MFDIKKVPELYVYAYHYIDDPQFLKRPEDVRQLSHMSDDARASLVTAVAEHFKAWGWSGVGSDVGLLWLPPFVISPDFENTGEYIWHVKQNENGTSYLASEVELPFASLARNSGFVGRVRRRAAG